MIAFHHDLYPLGSIQSAIAQFKGLGRFKVVSRGKYHQVEILDSGLVEGQERLTNEFKNYVLFLTITHAKN